MAADRHLLLGLLALQNGLIQPAHLVAAFHAWTGDRSRSLADHLIALGHLNPAQRSVVEALADLHVAAHGGDIERSLAAVPAGKTAREELAGLGDPDLEATLGHLAPASRSTDVGDADRTASYAVGELTGDGQRYRILRPHARGGLGAVFVALDEELHREVALKQILDAHADDPISRHRFVLEAEVTGGLEHPGIVPVYGLGTYAGGRPYYAMRFIRGGSLKEAIEQFHADESLKNNLGRRSLALRKLLRRFIDVCNAIDYAHSRGVLHRDIKPANVIVGKHGETLVVDWGLAKPIGRVEPGSGAGERTLVPSSASGSSETLPGSALGTPAYMSPEQARGDLDRLGPRSDVYSLGATLYCLLTGKPPFEGDDVGAILQKVQNGDFVPPREASPTLDRALEAVCLMAMDSRPEKRYPSSRALAEDVERWMADETVSAWPEPWTRTLLRWLTRHRTGVTGAAAAVLAGVVGLSAVLAVQSSANVRLRNLAAREARAREEAQDLARKEANARAEAQDLAAKEARARGEADRRTEQLARADYVNRVNLAYREAQDDNVSLAEDLLHGCDPRRRGWEWRFVERLCNSERRILDLGNRSVNALAYGPGGTWAVSGSGGQTFGAADRLAPSVDVWDVSSGERRKSLAGAKGVVYGVAGSPDGKRVAASCSGGLVLVWDVTSGQNVWARQVPGLDAMSVDFSPDGKSLAVGYGSYSGNQVGSVKIWEVASGKEIKAFPGPRGGVNDVAFHPDGKRLAVAGSEVVEIWELEGPSKLHALGGHKKWVYCLVYSPDGKWLATGGWDNTVKLWDAATGAERLTIFAHEGFVLSVAFSPDSRSLVTSSEDRSNRLWEVPSGRRLATFHGHTDFVQAAAFRPDGREVGTGSADGSIRFWDLRTSRPVVVGHTGWVERLAFRRDGLRVLSEAGYYRTDSLPTKGWDPFTGELDSSLAGIPLDTLPRDFVMGSEDPKAVTSPDGKRVAQVGAGGASLASRSKEYSWSSVIVRDSRTGEILHTLTGHSMEVVAMAFSPDGRRLATASFDRIVKLWDMETGQDVFTLRGHTAGVRCVAFNPDGNQIVTGGIDFTARVWNATPLASNLTAEHDSRYRKKIETLEQLKATTDDVRRAEILAGSGQWSMASQALARALEKEPGKLSLRYLLIDALVQSGDTNRVGPACDAMLELFGSAGGPLQARNVADFCRLARLAVTAPEQRQAVRDMALPAGELGPATQQQLLSLVESGDLSGYRAAACKLLSRFRKAAEPNTLNNAAWYCIFAPDAVADLTVPVLMAEAAMAGYPDAQKRIALNTLGVALYRAGRIDEAIARLDESVKAFGGGVPQDWVFLAMAHHKKGHAEEARRWLEKTHAGVKDDPEVPILLREAEALLKATTPPDRP